MHGQYDWTQRPEALRQGLRVGHGLPRRPVAPLPQLHAPHPHQHRRQGPRHRLRRPAHVRGPARGSPYYLGNPLYAAAAGDLLPVRRGDARPRVRAHRRRRDDPGARSARCSSAIWRKVRRQTLKDYVLFPALAGPSASRSRWPATRPPTWPATSGRSRSSSAATSPTARRSSPRRRPADETRGQWYFRQLLGSANLDRRQAVPHPGRQPQPPDRAPPLPRPPGPPLRRDLGRGARDLRALRHPVQHRPAAQAVRQRRPEDREARPAGPPRGSYRRRTFSRPGSPEPQRSEALAAAV